jgi:hypothetical protein
MYSCFFALNGLQIGEVAGIRKSVEVDEFVVRIFFRHHQKKIRADKSGSTSDQNSFQ